MSCFNIKLKWTRYFILLMRKWSRRVFYYALPLKLYICNVKWWIYNEAHVYFLCLYLFIYLLILSHSPLMVCRCYCGLEEVGLSLNIWVLILAPRARENESLKCCWTLQNRRGVSSRLRDWQLSGPIVVSMWAWLIKEKKMSHSSSKCFLLFVLPFEITSIDQFNI